MGTTGHEAEFRALFAQECAGQLERIGGHALDLERDGGDPEVVASLFRDAHTIKSTSALVGLPQIARIAHALEDAFEQLRSGARPATSVLVDGVLAAVDTLRAVIGPMVAGETRDAELEEAERSLLAAVTAWSIETDGLPAPDPKPAAKDPQPPTATPDPAPTGSSRSELPMDAAPAASTRSELPMESAQADSTTTMLVPVSRLDGLVRLAGEALAAQQGIEHAASARGESPDDAPEILALSGVLGGLQRQVLAARTVTVGSMAAPLRRAVRDAARVTGKQVRWEIDGERTELDRHVLERLRDPLSHLVRNAVDHGLESPAGRAAAGKPEQGLVRLVARPRGSEVEIEITDDGAGLQAGTDTDAIFRPGFSTAGSVTELSGRGVGLDVVRTIVEELRGRVELDSEPGRGCRFRIVVPLTLAVLPCLVAEVAGRRFALPFHSVETVLEDPPEAELAVEGRRELIAGDRTVPVTPLTAVLGLDAPPPRGPVLLTRGRGGLHGLRVDALEGRRDVLVKELGDVLGDCLALVSGAGVEADGSVLLVLDGGELVARAAGLPAGDAAPAAATGEPAPAFERVLVVEDAMTIRELQRSMLVRAGYAVETAVDGEEALARLTEEPFDLVVTDVEMPRMDGFALTRAVRAHPRLSSLPVVIVTSLACVEDRRRGMECGADAYLVKNELDEAALVQAVARTLGKAA